MVLHLTEVQIRHCLRSRHKLESMNHQPYLTWIEQQQTSMQQMVTAWANINSGSHNLAGLATVQQAMADAFKCLGGKMTSLPLPPVEQIGDDGRVQQLESGQALQIVKRPDAAKRILLCGHMDTVFPADSPFQSCRTLDPDTLNGPGVADMKGGIVVMLHALAALERSPESNSIGWEVLITPDEETGSHGSASLLAQRAAEADIGMIFEPSMPDGTLAGQRKGSGNFTLVVRGKAAHAGREPHLGRNAIAALAQAIAQIDSLNGERPEVTFNVGKITGGGATNIVPDLAICRFNIRVPDLAAIEWCSQQLDNIVKLLNDKDGITATLKGQFDRQPKPFDDRLASLFKLLELCGDEIGVAVNHIPTGGCCDGNNLAAAGLPNIDTLGVQGGNIHSEDEYVILSSLAERAKLSALFMLKLASGEADWPTRNRDDAAQGGASC